MSKPTHPACMIAQGAPDPALVRCRFCRLIPSACDASKRVNDGQPCCPNCTHDG